jgi:hypothetical protein
MLDSTEVADSEHAHAQLYHHHQQQQKQRPVTPDSEVLTSLVAKLRDFLVVNMPQNGVENSLRRFDSEPLPALRYT